MKKLTLMFDTLTAYVSTAFHNTLYMVCAEGEHDESKH